MKMTITMALVGGLAIAGAVYFIKNPKKFKMVKDMEIDAVNKMNQVTKKS